MSTSLRITGGDLTVGAGRSYETVSGADKLAQDLRLWVLAKIGQDPATPNFGSSIDGGTINDQPIPSTIGQLMSQQRIMEVRASIIELLTQYQTMQLAKMKQDMIDFRGSTTLQANEVVSSVENVEATGIGDTIIVRATIKTMANTTLTLTLPVDF